MTMVPGRLKTVCLFACCMLTLSLAQDDPSILLGAGGTFNVHHSPSQLGLPSTAEVQIFPGTSFDTGDTVILDRYDCGDYKVIIAPTGTTREVRLTVLLTGLVAVGDNPVCTVNWGDGSTATIDFSGDNWKEYVYPTYGIYQPSIDCTSDVSDSTCPNNDVMCLDGLANFFDDSHQSFEKPLKFFTTEDVFLDGFLSYNTACTNTTPEIKWRINAINKTLVTPYTNFVQPNTTFLLIEKGTMEPGEYVVFMEVSFPHVGPGHWGADSIAIRIIYPELVAHIYGGDQIDAALGTTIIVDASVSFDPAGDLSEPLLHKWSVAKGPLLSSFVAFRAKFPRGAFPSGATSYEIQNGTDYFLQIDTSQFTIGTYLYVIFSLIRGERESSFLQVITISANTIPLYIDCVYNCNLFREHKFNQDRIELDTVLPDFITDTSGVLFTWYLYEWSPPLFFGPWFWAAVGFPITQTGPFTRSLMVDGLVSGSIYRILVIVSVPGYAPTYANVFGLINYQPYAGTCNLNSLVGVAARDWFVLTCTGWLGSDDRHVRSSTVDVNPYLTYKVRQRTTNAWVEEEPVLKTRFETNYIILKVGDPDNLYLSTLIIRISDIYNNYIEVPLSVTANPAFPYYDVNATTFGSDIIRNYTNVDYIDDDLKLRQMGKIDLVVSLVSSICSHIHLTQLPIWTPPVPRVLNTDGNILDLNPSGNKDVGDLGTVLEDAKRPMPDDATLTLIELTYNLTSSTREMYETFVVNGSRGSDKHLISKFTCTFTNLAAREQFTNNGSRADMIYLGEEIGIKSLKRDNTSVVDEAPEIETAAGEVHNMSMAIVGAVVPNTQRQARLVTSFIASKTQIGDILDVKGDSIDTSKSALSPAERAYLYQKMQQDLILELDESKKEAKQAADMARRLALQVQDSLALCRTCSNEDSPKNKQLVKQNGADVIGADVNRMDGASFRVDSMIDAVNTSKTSTVSLSAIELKENVFLYDDDLMSSYVKSSVIHVDTKASDALVTPDVLSFGQTVIADTILVTPLVDPEDASEFSPHKFTYQTASDYVCLLIKPEDEALVKEYHIYINFRTSPTLIDYDLKYTLTAQIFWKVCIEPSEMKGHTGATFLSVQVPEPVRSVKYEFTLATSGCMTWVENDKKWYTDKCWMTWAPEFNKINCFCNNLTELTFANTFFVAPNTIDFGSVFLKFSPLSQAAVMGALGGLFLLYIIAVLLLIDLDRKDKLKWGITPLRDNIYGNDHYYIIKVFTGMRKGSGTRSRIAFDLTGSTGKTGPRELFDGVRQEYSTGSVITLFMATRTDLGPLLHLNIWHDNSGPGKLDSWYLNYIAIYDFERDESSLFIAEGWLSLETTLELKIHATRMDEAPEFETRFFRQTRDRLSESHMWASILYRPSTSSFTRVQRVSCAVVYICLAMIANAMYFNPDPNYNTPPLVQLGPFRFTSQQIFISLICALITTPVVMVLIFLFKRTRPWPKKQSKDDDGGCCCCCACACSRVCARWFHSLFRTRKKELRKRYEEALQVRLLSSDVPNIEGGFSLPYGFIIFAWFLVFAGTIVPAFFIMLYSMEWGKQKSEEWLTSFLLSVIQSIIFVDPVVVICMSFLLACLLRKPKEAVPIDKETLIRNYKRWMGELNDDKESYPRNVTKPPKGAEFAEAAEQHRHQQRMTTMMKDILANLFFMMIVFCICYTNRNYYHYQHHKEITTNMVYPFKGFGFHSIKTPGDMFQWVNVTAIPYLFPEYDVNGDSLHWTTKQFTKGFFHFRVGPPRLRQLRIENDTCHVPYLGTMECYGEYGFFSEVEESSCVGWSPYAECTPAKVASSSAVPAWSYTSALDVWGLPIPGQMNTYGGGGYMSSMYINREDSVNSLNELRDNLWLDRQTRAVFFECTFYCAETNTFIYNMFLVEFPETGGAITTHSTYPMLLYPHQGPSGIIILIVEVIFVIYIIALLVKICIRFYQQRCGYFKKFWQSFECLILLVSLGAIVMYCFRLLFTSLTLDKFKEDVTLFVNFSHVVLWDQMFVSLMAILVFMATIRFLEVFSTSKKVVAVVKIFNSCGMDLFWFATTFLYILIGFCGYGFLLFGSQLNAFKDLYMCLRTLSLVLLGDTDYNSLNEVQPIFAKIFFVLYIIAIVFFVMTIFMAILGGSIDDAVQDKSDENTEDLIEHLMKKVKTLIVTPTSKKNNVKPKASQKDKKERDSIEKETVGRRSFLNIKPEALTQLTQEAMVDMAHLFRTSHLQQLSAILKDPEASMNDRFIATEMLKNACVSAGMVLPACQDTGTAICVGKKGQNVLTDGEDAKWISKGVYNTYTQRNLRYSQISPLDMYSEVNTRTNLPAQIELYTTSGSQYDFLFVAKGGGSANKAFLYQQTKALLNPDKLLTFLDEKIKTLGTAACPPYHLAVVVGGTSAEFNMKTLKLATCRYLDNLPTSGNEHGRGFRDIEMEKQVHKLSQKTGIGAQFGGKYFCHDVRVIRLPRHGASCPVSIGVSCSADRQILGKIDETGVYLEQLETNPAQFLPDVDQTSLSADVVKINLNQPMSELLRELDKLEVQTRVSLTGTMIVARDIAHAKLKEGLDRGEGLPEYFKQHPVIYAGPSKTPADKPTGSIGPTTGARMDPYTDEFQRAGGSMIMVAKGNRGKQVVTACKQNGGFYLGSIGGIAGTFAQDCFKSIELLEYPELGMEAIYKVEVEDFPAFVVIDNKGNDFFKRWTG